MKLTPLQQEFCPCISERMGAAGGGINRTVGQIYALRVPFL